MDEELTKMTLRVEEQNDRSNWQAVPKPPLGQLLPSAYHHALPNDAPRPTAAEVVVAAQILLNAMAGWVRDEEHAWLRDVLPYSSTKTHSFVSSLWLLVEEGGTI